jgi:hypothetical protein
MVHAAQSPFTSLSDEERSKDEFFAKLAQVGQAMICAHGKEFAMGALILTARYIAQGGLARRESDASGARGGTESAA